MLRCDIPFWKFSLAVYAQPGVASECLALQSALGIDVNVLLFCAWLGAEKKLLLNDKDFETIDACVRRWHEMVVRPLRSVRQTMKPMPEMADEAVQGLRKDIAAIELRAEQIEQALLFEETNALSANAVTADDAETAIRANITAFVQRNATGATATPAALSLIAAAIGYQSAAPSKTLEK